MTKQALIELRDKVAAGELDNVPRRKLWVDFDIEERGYEYRVNVNAAKAYHGSLDAAVAFLEAVLPETPFWVERRIDGRVWAGLFVGNLGKTFQAYADTPARALLLATLDALIEGAE